MPDLDDLQAALARVGGPVLERSVHERLAKASGGLQRKLRARLPSRSGRLRRSATVKPVDSSSTELLLRVDQPYAEAQERGGVIRAAGWLAIPLGPMRGTSLRGPRADAGVSFLWRSPSGALFAVGKQGRSIQLRWLLTRSIRLKGHHGAEHTARRSGPVIGAAIDAGVVAALDGARG